jgi:pimeloyl-ACP methyl ester carboxylesterase
LPTVKVKNSPLIPEADAVEIYYRESGHGTALIHLHGGWGYAIYPFDRQIDAFNQDFKVLIPDRSGYGRSQRMKEFPVDFHRRAAGEMMRFLDALEIDRAVLWGHSDGAVIAAMMGLEAPDRFHGLILEAFHYYRSKPSSAAFFTAMAENPDTLGERVARVLSEQHGEDYWRELINTNGYAWLHIAEASLHDKHDIYDGRLSELRVPTLFIHGSRDPRTEPGELDAVRKDFPQARMHIIEGGGHTPHAESASYEECNRAAAEFLSEVIDLR